MRLAEEKKWRAFFQKQDKQQSRNKIEVVANAEYGKVTPENVEGLLPEFESVYMESWIEPDQADLLLSDEVAFQQTLDGGVFVFAFDKSQNNFRGLEVAPSVKEQMLQAFLKQPNENGIYEEGQYFGRFLRASDGRVIAWATWTHPPLADAIRTADGLYAKAMSHYLESGVTGKMQYRPRLRAQNFKEIIHQCVFFDTVASAVPFAAARLFAEITAEMTQLEAQVDNPALRVQYFLVYRLSGLHIDAHKGSAQFTLPGDNLRSGSFFFIRGCSEFAEDFSVDGPVITAGVDEHTLHPAWMWMCGKMKNVEKISRKEWEERILTCINK
ncbi:MAG: hypothetical protein ACE5DM_05940 [Candidatus Nanoarchaeia archaeon]